MGTEWLRHNEHDDEGVAMALGERIRELRKEAGWSQAELGKRIGTDSQYVSRYETGRITPSADALVRLADVLELSTDYLVRDGAPRQVLEGHDLGKLGDGSRTSPNFPKPTKRSPARSSTPLSPRAGSRSSPVGSAEAWGPPRALPASLTSPR